MVYCNFCPNKNGMTIFIFTDKLFHYSFNIKTNKNGPDTSISNQRPSISNPSGILRSPKERNCGCHVVRT